MCMHSVDVMLEMGLPDAEVYLKFKSLTDTSVRDCFGILDSDSLKWQACSGHPCCVSPKVCTCCHHRAEDMFFLNSSRTAVNPDLGLTSTCCTCVNRFLGGNKWGPVLLSLLFA